MHQLFWDVPLGNSCKVLRIWALEGQENVEFILSHMCYSLQSNHFCYNRVGQGSVPFYNQRISSMCRAFINVRGKHLQEKAKIDGKRDSGSKSWNITSDQ